MKLIEQPHPTSGKEYLVKAGTRIETTPDKSAATQFEEKDAAELCRNLGSEFTVIAAPKAKTAKGD